MADYILRPNADETAGWTETPTGAAWSAIDDAVEDPAAPNTGDYIESILDGEISRQAVTTVALGSNERVTTTEAHIHGSSAGTNSDIICRLKRAGGVVIGTTSYVNGQTGWKTISVSGALTQADIDALAVEFEADGISIGARRINCAYVRLVTTFDAPVGSTAMSGVGR